VAETRAERRLTTILAADVVGYSRLMAADEAGTLAQLKALRKEIVEPKTTEFNGRVVKLMGDGTLMEFVSVVDALTFAVEVQRAMAERNDAVPEDRRIAYRIGINIGDIIVEGDDIYGDGVNVAARLEALAEPGGICLSRSVHTQVKGKVDVAFKDLGEQDVKNIPEPVQVFQVLLDQAATPSALSPAAGTRRRLPAIAAGLALSLLAVAVMAWWASRAPEVEPASPEAMAFPLPDKPSIAVLPFNNMSEDRGQDYFADGMTEDLITDLSKISGLFVIARNSSFSYKGRQVKIRQVAEELGVRYVLEGSVRRAGDEVRINVQLIDATTGGHLWAERYDGTLEDVFDLQDQVTEQIVAALAVSLTGTEQAEQARHDTEIAQAHDAYLQGWARYKLGTPEDLKAAVPFFEEALRLDPIYAQAHAALASLYWDVYVNDWAFDLGMPSTRAESRANAHLEEALKSPVSLAHALRARMLASWQFYDDAVSEAEKAVALDENDATALAGLADALIKADRAEEALANIEPAMRLDPHHPPSYLIILGAAQFGMEHYDTAAATFERAVKRNPDNELPLIYLASSYGHLGRIREADTAVEMANDIRAKLGLGDLSLERKERYFSPFQGEIDFTRIGGKSAENRVRAGLSNVPALTWQYRITMHEALGFGNTTYEVEGVTEIDIRAAKSLHDQGAVFIDVSNEHYWNDGHIPGAVHLPLIRFKDPNKARFQEMALRQIADFSDEIVLHCFDQNCPVPAFAAAKAANWGYQHVYMFIGGAPAWKEAGYPIETGP
jgi:TolB-like protein/class 3 adenylate cyclase/rhodanese-related sulfurtransferase